MWTVQGQRHMRSRFFVSPWIVVSAPLCSFFLKNNTVVFSPWRLFVTNFKPFSCKTVSLKFLYMQLKRTRISLLCGGTFEVWRWTLDGASKSANTHRTGHAAGKLFGMTAPVSHAVPRFCWTLQCKVCDDEVLFAFGVNPVTQRTESFQSQKQWR